LLIYKNNVRCLILKSPSHYTQQYNDIFIDQIKKYFNINKLVFKNLNTDDKKYLNAMISYLSNNIFLINKIKKLEFNEIKHLFNFPNNTRRLNKSLLKVFSHEHLESVRINYSRDSNMDEYEVQKILNYTSNLKKITLDTDYKNINITFNQQKNLIKATFNKLRSLTVIESLKQCTTLQQLILIHNATMTKNKIKDILLEEKIVWPQLKKLYIPNILITSNEELNKLTKNYSNLEHLCINCFNVNDYTLIGANCTNLQILTLVSYRDNISLNQYKLMTMHLPQLKMLSLYNKIIANVLVYISNNCYELQILCIKYCGEIRRSAIDVMVNKLKNLIMLKIDFCEFIMFQDLKYLIDNLPKLKYVMIGIILLGTSNEQRDIFNKKYLYRSSKIDKYFVKYDADNYLKFNKMIEFVIPHSTSLKTSTDAIV
jgi:hypothetical protein